MTTLHIPSTSRAAIQPPGATSITIGTRDTPKPQNSEVLLKVSATGVCLADVILSRRPPDSALQMKVQTGGHEGAGQIVALGPDADAAKWRIGDRVAVRWVYRVCNHCDNCRRGSENRCLQRVVSGKDVDGTFAEYMLAESTCLARIPDSLNYVTAAPILCAGVTVYRALRNADLARGDWVAIVGAGGGLGHLGIQYAAAMGLRVVALDTNRRELCLESGAKVYVDIAETQDVVKTVLEVTDGGVQGAIVVAPSAKAYSDAGQYLRQQGTLVCVALSSDRLQLTPSDFIFKGITVKGSSTGSTTDTEEALAFAARGEVTPKVDLRQFEDIQSVIDDLESGRVLGKAVLKIH